MRGLRNAALRCAPRNWRPLESGVASYLDAARTATVLPGTKEDGMHAIKRSVAATSLVVASTLSGVGPIARTLAIHDDNLFQLDYVTNPTTQGAANVSHLNALPAGMSGDDWDLVYSGATSAFATAFIEDGYRPSITGADPARAEKSFFTGGGSKDTNGIQKGPWKYGTVSDQVPDSDDIVDAFAAAYEGGDGDLHLYFGADRLDWTGDKQIGFWFFRRPVSLGPVAADGTGMFTGTHTNGDILVLADFRNGGRAGRVTVYRWQGDDATGSLVLVADRTEADCSVTADDKYCAVVNNVTGEDPPWPYINKDGTNVYGGAGALFEGGINLNEVLGVDDIGCYSSFLAETRSSHSTNAQLKDFVLGAFAVCDISVTKTGSALSKIGDTVDYTITVQNTGYATLYKRNIADTLLGPIATDGVNVDPNGYVIANTCGASLSKDEACTITMRRTVQAGDPDPLPNTVDVLYTENADFSGIECTASDDHSVNLFQPAVMIAKDGDTLSKAGDEVRYSFTITNMSSLDTPELVLQSIDDNVIGSLMTDAAAAGCDVLGADEVCSFSVRRIVAGGDPDPLVNIVDVIYRPQGFPNEIVARDGHSVNLFQPSVSIYKKGDMLSKIGDGVTYGFRIENTSSKDSPDLVLDSIVDDVLGDLSSYAASCASIAPGDACSFEVPWTVAPVDLHPQDGAPDDPIINTVVVRLHPDGFPNEIMATASHELNLFQPAIAFEKTADTSLSKIGDTINYRLVLNNLSSPDTPDLNCVIRDAMLDINGRVQAASGTGIVIDVAYTVKEGDPDPLVNTATAICNPLGFPNVYTAASEFTVELFQPSVKIEKFGDALSKAGDDVTYRFKVTNTSSPDSPNLMLDSFSDDVLLDLMPNALPAGCDNLAPGATCEFEISWTVPFGMPDPIINVVTVHYHPVGYPNDISASARHELNLFQPSILFSKRADTALSKVGHDVNYELVLQNTSSDDAPPLECTVIDPLLDLDRSFTLVSGGTDTTIVARTILEGDPDPLVNTAAARCSPLGFPNVLTATDQWRVNLFQPGLRVAKTGPQYTKQGDTATYQVMIENIGSADSPDLILTGIADTLVGSLMSIVGPASTCEAMGFRLASGASCTIQYDYLVTDGSGAALTNTVQVQSRPDGFTNSIDGEASTVAQLLHPGFSVTKYCAAEPVPQAGPALFKIRFANTGDADLYVVPSEGAAFDVGAGKTYEYEWSVAGPFTAVVRNSLSGEVTLAPEYGLSNAYSFSASAECAVYARANVSKTVAGALPPAGQTYEFQLRQGASITTEGSILESRTTDPSGVIEFAASLIPGASYQLCEVVMPGWNTNLASVGDGPLFVPGSVIPPTLPNPNVNNMTVCVPFTTTSGQTRTFAVDNAPPPGGRALTIGFWKNWASCAKSSGSQKPTLDRTLALANVIGDSTDGHATLPGIVISAKTGTWWKYGPTYYLVLHGSTATPNAAPDCLKAVRLLDKSTIDTGKKMASDPAFNLAAQLTAAELNFVAGAYQNGVVTNAVNESVLLLAKYSFDGKTHTKISATDAARMNALATILDNYNNNR
jgi:hypothetical protein